MRNRVAEVVGGGANVTVVAGGGAADAAAATAVATAVAISVADVAGVSAPPAVGAAARVAGAAGAGASPAAELAISFTQSKYPDTGRKCRACVPIIIFKLGMSAYAIACCSASLSVAVVSCLVLYLLPTDIKNEHRAHNGPIVVTASAVSTAIGTIVSSRIVFLIIVSGSSTNIDLDPSASENNSSMLRNASAYMLFICTCASGYIGCLEKM